MWPWVLDFGSWIHVYRFRWRWLGFSGFPWDGWSVMEVEIGVAVEINVAVGKMGFCHDSMKNSEEQEKECLLGFFVFVS